MVFVVTVIATIIVYFVVLDTQNVGTLFLLFFLIFEFGISMIMFAFIFTTLFSNAKVRKKKGKIDLYPIFLLLFAVLSCCLFQAAAGVGGLVTIMAACFYYIQVFAEGAPTPIFWVLSLLSQPAFAMAIDKVSV